MIGRAAIALICIMAPAALALGYWQGQSTDLDVAMAPRPISAPTVPKPSEGAADAVRYLASINSEARPAATTPAASKPDTSGPQIDIGVQFRRDVTAVLTGDDPHVVLSGGKQLGAGDVYRDGWKLRDLSGQRATLTKGTQRRDVDLFSAPPPAEVQVASSTGRPLLTGPIELTNGVTADQRMAQMQAQRQQMMQMIQQQLGFALPGGAAPGGPPGGRGRANGGSFGGPGGAPGGFTFDPSQFRQGSGGRPRQGGANPQGATTPPSVPAQPATTPDSGTGRPE